ncbi:MAG: alpha/beta fold hydrolase [Actinobacteria bacterium]|nr:alpha/beta fold hydrolase [Actinomycetota bacterium]
MGARHADLVARPSWLAHHEFPFASRFVDVDGTTVHYVDEGSGPTLLFVHAGPAWSFIFRGVIGELRQEFRCVALDLPGSGLSPARPGERPTMAASSQLVDRFFDIVAPGRVTLVVHDVGGPVALAMASRRPERIAAVVVAESFGWPLAGENQKVARALRVAGGRAVRWLNTATNLVPRLTASRYGAGRHLDSAGRAAFLGPYRDRAVRRRATALLADAGTDQAFLRSVDSALRTTLAHLPLLLVFGSASPTVSGGFPTSWTTRFPAASLFLVEGAHHFPMMDDPVAVADVIASWWGTAVDPISGQTGAL